MGIGKQEKTVFGVLNKWEALFIIAFSLICFALASSAQGNILAVLTLTVSLIFSLSKRRSLALSSVVVAGPLMAQLSTGFLLILSYVPFLAISLIRIFARKMDTKSFALYVCCLLIVFVSYIFGYKPDGVMLQLQIITMTVFYTIYASFERNQVPIVILGYICSALIVFGLMSSGGFTSFTDNGRLSFGEHVKDLAFTCAIPMSFILVSFIGKKFLFSNMTKNYFKIIDGVLLALFLVIILMTLARGVILALAAGTALLLILSRQGTKSIIIFIVVASFVVYAFSYLESLDLFRTNRMMAYDEYVTGNGRMEIWTHHFKNMYEFGIQYILLGIGPGNISRISNTDYYGHSTILDYYFSYGIIGLVTFLLIELQVLKKLFRRCFNIPFVIVFTFILAYSTHGGAANISFFMLQALMLASVKNTRKT